MTADAEEGTLRFRGFDVWYRIVGARGEAGRLPLLCLHGGPGAPHDYLEPLEGLARTGRAVIFYDQLGCGSSDKPHAPSLWTVDLFVEELGAVRRELGLDRVHVLGHSWGGMLAMEHALTQPSGLASLVLASAPASMTQWAAETNRLRLALPGDVQATLDRNEQAGTTETQEYEDAVSVFYRRHVCRLDPWPDHVNRTFDKLKEAPEVYVTMVGPSEFHVTGSLKDWDIVSRLHEIQVPTLVTSGRYDEATPLIAETVHNGVARSQWVLFEESSHMAHVEEPARYANTVASFLERVEAETRAGASRA